MKDKAPHSKTEILRQKAEEILKNKPIIVDTLCLQGETLKLIHELDVHQIELEMQNEELIHTKEQIEIAAEKYIDLYDFAPSGYFTLSRNGEIHKVNFKGANMLGKERSLLLNNRFGFFLTNESKSIFSSFLDRIFESKTKETCEIALTINPETLTYLLLNGNTVEDSEECFIAAVDISKRKAVEKDLRENEEKYRTLFDSNRDSITIFRLNAEGKAQNFIEANAAASAIYGYTKEELMNMNVRDLEPITQKIRKQRIETLLANGRLDLETTIKTKKGKFRNVEIEVLIINYMNEPAVMNITRDITERKQIELNAAKTQENLVTILEAIPDLLFEVGIDGRIHYYHAHRLDLLAVPPEVFMGNFFQDVLPAEAATTCMEAIQEADEKGWSIGKQYSLDITKTKHWFELAVSPIKESDSKDKHFILLARDVTVRKLAEIALQENEKKLQGVFNVANSGIVMVDTKGKFVLFNDWCCEMLGYNREEFSDLNNFDITHPDDYGQSKLILDQLITGKIDKFQIEKRYLRKDKSFFWGEISVSAIKDENNNFIYAIGIIIDISERKQTEEKLIANENFLKQTQIIANLGSYCLDFATGKWTSTAILDIIFGIDADFERTADGWESILHPEWKKIMHDYLYNEVIGKRNNFNKEYKIIKVDSKEERWLHGMGEITFNKEGQPSQLIGSIQDITERKLIEEKLKTTSEKFQDLVNSTGGIVWEADAVNFNFTYVSKQAERLLGYPAEDWYTEGFWINHLHSDDKEKAIEYCVSFTKLMKSHDFIYRFIAKNGKIIWLRDIVNVIAEEGKPKWLRGVMFDITSQKENEESLRESEEKYRGLVENSPDAVVIYVEEKIVFINQEGLRMVAAKNKKEIIGKPVLQFVHPDSLDSIIKRMEEVVLDNNSSETVEEKFIDLNGKPIDVEIKAIPTFFEHKPAVQVIIHDISRRKQSTFELNKINRVYSLISQINNLILRSKNREELLQEICRIAVTYGKFRMSWIGMLDDDSKNVNTAAFYGVEDGYFSNDNKISILDEPSGQGPTGTAMREGRTIICNNIATDFMMERWRERAKLRGYRSSIAIPIVVLDKIIGSFNLYSEDTNSFSSEEEVELLEKITQNIAFTLESIIFEEDRIKTQEKIKQLSQAVEQSPVTIVITNTKGEIEYVNPKFSETTGYTFDEVVGQNPRILKSGHTTPEDYKLLWQTLSAGNEWHGEFHNVRKDGESYWESASISPILNAQGKTTHFIAIKEDITERKNVEKELIKAKEKAEESDRLKLAFLANMSHEIRTPMNGILGFTELLKSPLLAGEEQQEYIRIIEKSGIRMLNIINDIISISKVESGQIEISLSETNVNEQIEYLHTFFKPEAAHKGIQLSVTNQLPSKETLINTDKEKVYAILTNLIKNAIKFTDSGSIEFGCAQKGKHLEYFVKDTGAGISKSQQKIIFERFRQANETITRSHEGSGLGLAISKAYVEMLGGKIWVDSKQGKGSTFYFTIPTNTELKSIEKITIEKVPSKENEENQIKDLKVLIVEDDEISKLLITIAVKTFSKEILKVSTGFEAIEACRNNPDIDLVMMDINMPEMGGYEATEQIRKFNKDVVIIAQTANGMQSDRDEAIAAGCTDYISKPVNIASLSELIHKYFKS
ncbi:MAG: hypothetical protein C0412_04370 [Flavobacterium sp.]|nr:hypothetical protein [Flavobacterium sp.]